MFKKTWWILKLNGTHQLLVYDDDDDDDDDDDGNLLEML
jgi:hypothetical protein